MPGAIRATSRRPRSAAGCGRRDSRRWRRTATSARRGGSSWSADDPAHRCHGHRRLRAPAAPDRHGRAGPLPGARPAPAGRSPRAGPDRAGRPDRPAVVPPRAARREHGGAPRGVDPRPAARFDRGAERGGHAAAGAGRRARGRTALRLLLRDGRGAPLAHALPPGEGAGARGGGGFEARDDRVQPLDRLHARRTVADALGSFLLPTGDPRVGVRAGALPADLGRGRGGLRGGGADGVGAAQALVRAGRAGDAHLRRDRPDRDPLERPATAPAARAAAAGARFAALSAEAGRPEGLRDLGGSRADGGADDDEPRHGGRGGSRREADADGERAGRPLTPGRGRGPPARHQAWVRGREPPDRLRLYIIPSMPPMPPPGMPAGSFSGISATIASVVRMFFPIDAAFWSAERVTIAGAITPAATRSTISPVSALRPSFLPLALRTSLTTTEPSRPAFSAIWRSGSSSARRTICAPVRSSPSKASSWMASCARRSATPPPATMPSSRAARVACSASSTRCFFSFISVSVAAPTFTTATPPAS